MLTPAPDHGTARVAVESFLSRWGEPMFDTFLVLAAAVVASLNAFWFYPELRHDDAFVTFQYARNLASGAGMVFNAGERVLGTTTPLFTFVLAGAYAMFGEALPRAAVVIGSFALACQALLVERLLRPLGRPLSVGIALLLLAGFSGGLDMLALETHLYAALILGAVLAFDRKHALGCGVLLGLAILCRMDAVLLFGLLAVGAWFERRSIPGKMLLGTSAVVVPWLIGSALYFGTVLPQTLAAKRNITPFIDYLTHVASHIARGPIAMFGSGESQMVKLFGLLLCVIGLRQLYRRGSSALWAAGFGALLVLGYACIGPHPTQYWHMYVPALMYRVACATAFLSVVQSAVSRSIGVRWAGATALAVSIAVATPMALHASGSAQKTVASFWLGQRHGRYADVSMWLAGHIKTGCSVLAPEVGTLGYLTQRRMIDASGLINETNDFPRAPSLANLAGVVTHYEPDVLLLDSREQGAFFERVTEYRVVKVFEWDPWSTILVRNHAVLKEPRALAAVQ